MDFLVSIPDINLKEKLYGFFTSEHDNVKRGNSSLFLCGVIDV